MDSVITQNLAEIDLDSIDGIFNTASGTTTLTLGLASGDDCTDSEMMASCGECK